MVADLPVLTDPTWNLHAGDETRSLPTGTSCGPTVDVAMVERPPSEVFADEALRAQIRRTHGSPRHPRPDRSATGRGRHWPDRPPAGNGGRIDEERPEETWKSTARE